jgi:site-specific DNA recombinase
MVIDMVNSTDHIIRVAIYTRVSSQEQAEKGTSLDSQAEQLEAFCKAQKWEVFNQYTDGGFSGKDDHRPALENLKRDAKAGYFEKIIVWRLDRLARNLRLILGLEAELREQDISLFSMKEMVDTSTSFGKHLFQMLGLIAEWERESIAERTKTGRLQREKEGHWAGGTPPFGFDYNRETKNLVINETEAEVIRMIYDLYASGKSLSAIADHLNKALISPRGKNAKGWYSTGIRQVLINPAYKGETIVNRHCHIADINKADLSKAIRIAVPPIVSTDRWNIAQARLSNNKHIRPTDDGLFTLQGLVKCGLCGCSYRAERMGGGRYYICRGQLKTAHIDGSPRCKNKNLRADRLEQAVLKRLNDIINDPNQVIVVLKDGITNLQKRESDLVARLQPIERRLREITEMKSRLADKFIIDNMDGDKYNAARQSLEKEEARLTVLRKDCDPNQLLELNSIREHIKRYQNLIDLMAWNLTTEESRMIRSVEEPHQYMHHLLTIGSKALSEKTQVPTTPRGWFDLFQLQLVVYKDKIGVKAIIPIPDIQIQEYTTAEGDRG